MDYIFACNHSLNTPHNVTKTYLLIQSIVIRSLSPSYWWEIFAQFTQKQQFENIDSSMQITKISEQDNLLRSSQKSFKNRKQVRTEVFNHLKCVNSLADYFTTCKELMYKFIIIFIINNTFIVFSFCRRKIMWTKCLLYIWNTLRCSKIEHSMQNVTRSTSSNMFTFISLVT